MTKLLQMLLATSAIVATITLPARADESFALPANEAGLPGEGALRRYDGYVNT